jgi:hypothetical protein
MTRFLLPLPLVLLFVPGCSDRSIDVETQDDTQAEQATTQERLFIADFDVARGAEVSDGKVLFKTGGDALLALAPGTVIVSGRGEPGKNDQGFLRRIVRADRDPSGVVVTTTNAALTDALVDGHLESVSDGLVAYDDNVAPKDVHTALDGIHIDVEGSPIFVADEGGMHDTARLERATIVAKPTIVLDLRIKAGAAARMTAIVDSDLDADVAIALEARGMRTRLPTAHTASIPLYTSPIVPLPERRVGQVPVAPHVQFVVTLDCTARFADEAKARMGLHVHGHARLTATYENGAWSAAPAPIEATPRVSFDRPAPLSARCALTTHATLGAYGIGGVTMGFAPFVDVGLDARAAGYGFAARAGTDASLSGSMDVFGVAAHDAPHVVWASPAHVDGVRTWPDKSQYFGY